MAAEWRRPGVSEWSEVGGQWRYPIKADFMNTALTPFCPAAHLGNKSANRFVSLSVNVHKRVLYFFVKFVKCILQQNLWQTSVHLYRFLLSFVLKSLKWLSKSMPQNKCIPTEEVFFTAYFSTPSNVLVKPQIFRCSHQY